MIVSSFLLFYYETEIGLNVWYVTIGYAVYAIWNAINDPLTGFITDRPRKYWAKWGRRFPLILFSGIPFLFTLILIFSPPKWDPIAQPWLYTLWFIFSACFFDTFFSILNTSQNAQYPEKYKSDRYRRTSGTIRMLMELLGTAVGAVVPGLIITYGNLGSYAQMSWVFVGIGFAIYLTYIPGHYESKVDRDQLIQTARNSESEPPLSFIRILSIMLRHKNFMIVAFIFFLDSIIGASLSASIAYVVKYDLGLEASKGSIVLAGFLLGAFLSMFVWLWFAQRINNNRKMLIIGVFLNTIFLLPLIFFWDLLSLLIGTIFLGIGGGALRVGRGPVMADVVDEAVIKSGKRFEGSLMGIYTFFNRLALVAQGLIFATVHTLTGFDSNLETQSSQALFGIRIHTALIPMILCLLGLIVFVKVYDITPKRGLEIKEQLQNMGI